VNVMASQLSQLQEAVRRAERLRLVGQLSGGLAHQLRNSVTGARLALQVHQASHPDESEALEVVLRQLRLMDSNLRRFIELGRENESRRAGCSLTLILEDVLSLLRPQADHVGIALTEELDPQGSPILGDASQLTDLFLNLLTNAIEAAGPGGAVKLRMGGEGEWHLVEVRDNGPGPPDEIAERLFEPFVTAKPEGIGLGLAVAKRATDSHGGTLDWRREGGETVFRVRLLKYDIVRADATR
jgi:signal transduction histidine kinase